MKLLLHACCGPCTLEPLRLLLEEGHKISIAYMNSNIQPKTEYDHRLETLLAFARDQGIEVIEGIYDAHAWAKRVGSYGPSSETRPDRCRACYRLRLEEAAAYAAAHGFDGLATTLTVSPYQYTAVIGEELADVCAAHGLAPVFHDYRENYAEATRRSREMGMYRQDYCGCGFSKVEADDERAMRAAERARAKAEREMRLAPIKAQKERELAARRAEKQEYASRRARQRAALKEYKKTHANR